MPRRPRQAARFTVDRLLLAAALGFALLACGLLPTGTAPTLAPAAAPETPLPPTATASPTLPPPTASPTRVERAPTSTAISTTTVPAVATAVTHTPDPAYDKVRFAVLDYLQANDGSVDGLAGVLEQTGMAPAATVAQQAGSDEKVALTADLDGDGANEVIVVAEDRASTSVFGSGALFVVDRLASRYAMAYDSTVQLGSTGTVTVLSVNDVNADGLPDVSFTTQTCGAHTCSTMVSVVSCQSGTYVDLAHGVSLSYPDLIALRDETGDARLEIVVHGGTYGSVGAGPQRAATYVYALQQGRYSLAELRYDTSDLIYFAVLDANTALAAGRIDTAIALYRETETSEALRASGEMLNGMTETEEAEALRSFARFRLVVAQTLAGNSASAPAALADAAAGGGPFAPLAEAYWAAYSQAGQVEDGCAAVARAAAQDAIYLDILNAFGYANPTFTPEDVCQGTGTVEQ